MKKFYPCSILLILIIALSITPVHALQIDTIQLFRIGDVNKSGQIDISDPLALLGDLFVGKPLPEGGKDLADTNGDGRVDISDAVTILKYLFLADQVSADSRVDSVAPVKELPEAINNADIVIINTKKGEDTISYGNLEGFDSLAYEIIPCPNPTNNPRLALLATGFKIFIKKEEKDSKEWIKVLDLIQEDSSEQVQTQNLTPPKDTDSSYARAIYALDMAQKEAVKQGMAAQSDLVQQKTYADSITPGLITAKLTDLQRDLIQKGESIRFEPITLINSNEEPERSAEFNFRYKVYELKSLPEGQDSIEISIPKQMDDILKSFINGELEPLKLDKKIQDYELREEDEGRIVCATLINPAPELNDEICVDRLKRPTQESLTKDMEEFIQDLTAQVKDYGLTLAIKMEDGFSDYQFIPKKNSTIPGPIFLVDYINNQYGDLSEALKENAVKNIPDGRGAEQGANYKIPNSNYYSMFQLQDHIGVPSKFNFARIGRYLDSVSYNGLNFIARFNNPYTFLYFWSYYQTHGDGLAFLRTHGGETGYIDTGWFPMKDKYTLNPYGLMSFHTLYAQGFYPDGQAFQSDFDHRWYYRIAVSAHKLNRNQDIIFMTCCHGDYVKFHLNYDSIVFATGCSLASILSKDFLDIIDSMTGKQGTDASFSLGQSFIYARDKNGTPNLSLDRKNFVTKDFVLYTYILSEPLEDGWTGDDFVAVVHFATAMEMTDLKNAIEVDSTESSVSGAFIPIEGNDAPIWENDSTVKFGIGFDENQNGGNGDDSTKQWIKVIFRGDLFQAKGSLTGELHGRPKAEDGLPDVAGHRAQRPTNPLGGPYEDDYVYFVYKNTADGLKAGLFNEVWEAPF